MHLTSRLLLLLQCRGYCSATGGRRVRRKQTIHGKQERPKGKLNKNEETHQYRRMGCLEIITGRVEETTINWIFDF